MLKPKEPTSRPESSGNEAEKAKKKAVQKKKITKDGLKNKKKKRGEQEKKKETKSSLVTKKLSKKDRPKLRNGTEIVCTNGRYLIVDLLGFGGFGDVYKAKKEGSDQYCAIKTELKEFNGRKLNQLKIEVHILEAIRGLTDEKRKKHFVKLFDKGRTETMKFIVMQLLGPNIDDLRRHIICADFSPSSAIRICQLSLQAIWDLHTIGFIHKDIKPQNFAVGTHDNMEELYIIDLGIAYRYRDRRTNRLKPQRENVRFMGTVRYASRNCLKYKDQSRKDDLETWIYMCAELFFSNILPWKRVTDRSKVLQEKENFFASPDPNIFERVPSGFENIMKYVNHLSFEDEPNYPLIQLTLEQIIKDDRINVNIPLDWTRRVTMEKGIHYKIKDHIESRDVSMIKDEDADGKSEKHDMKDSFEAFVVSSPCKLKSKEVSSQVLTDKNKSVYLFPGANQ